MTGKLRVRLLHLESSPRAMTTELSRSKPNQGKVGRAGRLWRRNDMSRSTEAQSNLTCQGSCKQAEISRATCHWGGGGGRQETQQSERRQAPASLAKR